MNSIILTKPDSPNLKHNIDLHKIMDLKFQLFLVVNWTKKTHKVRYLAYATHR